MKSELIIVFTIIFFGYSCMNDPSSEEESSPEDCTGVVGGENVCGCTDSTANNYNLEATYDDSSCLYDTSNTFNKTFGGSMGESGTVILASQNKIYSFGYTESYGQGNQDGFLVVTDKNGNQSWIKTYGRESNDYISDAIFYEADKIVFTGYSFSNYSISGDSLNDTAGDRDIWVVMINVSDGSIIWENFYGNQESSDFGRNIFYDNDGFVITGSTEIDSASISNGYAMRIDSQGEKIWEYTKNDSNVTNFSDFRSVFRYESQYVIMMNRYNDDASSNGGSIIKLDLDGTFISESLIHDNQNYRSTISESYYQQNGLEIVLVGSAIAGEGGQGSGYVSCVDLFGNPQWSFFTEPWSEFKSVIWHEDKIIIAGMKTSSTNGNANGHLVILDNNGNLLDEINYESDEWNHFEDVNWVDFKGNNEIVLTGYNQSTDGDGQLWIVRQECCA